MKMKNNNLSETEWSIMKICWEKGEATARTVYDESLKEKKREYQTVKTMLDRLVNKGYLRRKRFGPLWVYNPTVSRAKTLANAIDNFINIVLDNTLTPLFTHFIKKEKLSTEEIEALEKLIRKSKKGELISSTK